MANVLRSYVDTKGFLPPPTLREYVLWAADGTRAYASEANGEGEACYATAVRTRVMLINARLDMPVRC